MSAMSPELARRMADVVGRADLKVLPRVLENILVSAEAAEARKDRQFPRVPRNTIARAIDGLARQAAELESLRDEVRSLTPRVIDNENELLALPEGAVVRSLDGEVFERNDDPHLNWAWFTPAAETMQATSYIALPATVLYLPEGPTL